MIGTITNIASLNQRMYTARGNQAYGRIFRISELSKVSGLIDIISKKNSKEEYVYLQENRRSIMWDFCYKNYIKNDQVDIFKFACLTEGYTIGNLLQFLDRATFYAYRNGM